MDCLNFSLFTSLSFFQTSSTFITISNLRKVSSLQQVHFNAVVVTTCTVFCSEKYFMSSIKLLRGFFSKSKKSRTCKPLSPLSILKLIFQTQQKRRSSFIMYLSIAGKQGCRQETLPGSMNTWQITNGISCDILLSWLHDRPKPDLLYYVLQTKLWSKENLVKHCVKWNNMTFTCLLLRCLKLGV